MFRSSHRSSFHSSLALAALTSIGMAAMAFNPMPPLWLTPLYPLASPGTRKSSRNRGATKKKSKAGSPAPGSSRTKRRYRYH